jgi:zinc transporter
MVFGFVFRGGAAVSVNEQTLPRELARPHDWCWLHLALADHRTRKFLDDIAMPPAARAVMAMTEDRVQIHLTPDGAWGLLPDIERDFADHSLGAARYAFWSDATRLITTRRHPLRAVEGLRQDIEQEIETPSSPADTVIRLQEAFVAVVEQRLQHLSGELGQAEDNVLADRIDIGQAALGPMRRELSRYAREFAALSRAIHRATARKLVASSPLAEHLPHLLQEVEDVERDAAGQSDRARLLNDEVENRLAATTNRSLSALTVISTLMLPPTFVAGAFGMNVGGIPWAQNGNGFWAVLGFCILLIGASWIVLRRFRILP